MYWVGATLGALVATFLISRLLLWISRSWGGGAARIVAVHGVSILLIFVVAGFGAADGGPFRADAVVVYLAPQAIWLAFDIVGTGRARSRSNGAKWLIEALHG